MQQRGLEGGIITELPHSTVSCRILGLTNTVCLSPSYQASCVKQSPNLGIFITVTTVQESLGVWVPNIQDYPSYAFCEGFLYSSSMFEPA